MDASDGVRRLHLDPFAPAQAAPLINVSWFVQDVEDLLRCVCNAESAQELYRSGSVLLQHLQRARQRTRGIVAQEMKAVMEERDASISKVTCLIASSGAAGAG